MIQESPVTALGELISRLAAGSEHVRLACGATIYGSGTAADHIYTIQSGQVRLYHMGPDGTERLAEILGGGQWFGHSAFSERPVYASRAVAGTFVQLRRITAQHLMDQVTHHPAAAAELIRQLSRRAQTAREEARSIAFEGCNQRMIQAMLRLSDSAAATREGDNVVLHLTHEDLAQLIGVARETISVALGEMRVRGIVQTGRSRIIFNHPELQQCAKATSQREPKEAAA